MAHCRLALTAWEWLRDHPDSTMQEICDAAGYKVASKSNLRKEWALSNSAYKSGWGGARNNSPTWRATDNPPVPSSVGPRPRQKRNPFLLGETWKSPQLVKNGQDL